MGLGNFPSTGEGFDTNEGLQAKAIKGMIDRIMSD
jgi:hypothetical protein